MSNVCSDVGIQ